MVHVFEELNEIVKTGTKVKTNPLVSVIIPAYNLAALIAETLESVLAQTFTDFEIILVNDGSPDTEEFECVLEPYFERIVYVKRENGGAGAARNTGIKHSNGVILAFLDGDDIWLSDYLETQIGFMQENGYEMVSADAVTFEQSYLEGEIFTHHHCAKGKITFADLLSSQMSIITSGTIVLKRKFEEYGLFDETETWRRGQDFEMWLRLLKNNTLAGYLNKVLLRYRVRYDSLSGDNIQRAERNIMGLKAVAQTFELTPTEQQIWQERMNYSMAYWQIEMGKYQLILGEYESARKCIDEAIKYENNIKLKLINWLLLIAPELVRILFIKFRPGEVFFIRTTASYKRKTV